MEPIILGIDTAGGAGSVAISQGSLLRSEILFNVRSRHAERLMPTIDRALSGADCTLDEVDLVAVVQGPGSFTGLRVGLAAAKGISLALKKPLVGISSLQALAMNAGGVDVLICAMLDARKKEVYAGFFKMRRGRPIPLGEERVARPERLLSGIQSPTLFLGEGALVYREVIENHLGTEALFLEGPLNLLRASMVTTLAYWAVKDNPGRTAAHVNPVYLRPSEAEIAWNRQHGS